ncbi:hypothetical protein GGH12_001720 [Coemansia sp. RSA 1822]|nr:hypothetical protein LPJ76_001237 [Coemansia sp. RSA 638]KAJ2125389.1 hypothetical protein IW147_001035 [Coemansia sp. RSA 720]KAJ2545746.1 hypothetical protein GGF49_000255 [Coemansia sp. RSA 1853]KAJ2564907.1 hypothetical protein GGH12_001720 [Coemansia sp. RSA 1822]KAJ2662954.1 hypothetical protein IW148_002676 [Coemansia sp. RSA 1199]
MSQIEIRYEKARQREFCLLEAQGSLETDGTGGLRGQQKFAEIERQDNDQVLMRIGVHRVQGSLVKLKKPLAVLKKRVADDGSISYDIEAVVKEKFLFKLRPDVVL